MSRRWFMVLASLLLSGVQPVRADPPVASYIFPAGGQRGKDVAVRVGGLNLHQSCFLVMLGPGVRASQQLRRTRTVWFEGPVLPLPESQQQEDYPRDMAGRVQIAADAPTGVRYWRLWNSQGATPAKQFVVGDLPEIVEEEIDGDPVPVDVRLPVTINGRIFPREDVDVWAFPVRKGQTISAEVMAARLGSPLDSRLEVRDPHGRVIAENDDTFGADSFVRFTAAEDGKYQVRIHDVNFRGGQAYVYRLTLTAGPYVDRAYPLGGPRGSKVRFELSGQGLPGQPVEIALPASGPAVYAQRLTIDGQRSNPILLELDDLPEYLAADANRDPARVQPVALPAILNGRIASPGAVEHWAVTAGKGDAWEFDLRAGRLGSPLRAVLTITDASGKQLARSDGLGGQGDPVLRFTAPAGGTYRVRVEEYFRSRGGPPYAYRLRIDRPPAPDFRLRLGGDALSLNRGGLVKLKVLAERQGGFAQPIALAVDGLPRGVTVLGTSIAANQGGTEITFKAEAAAPIRAARLTVRGSARVGERTLTRTATLPAPRGVTELDSVLLAVSLPTPFRIKGQYDMRWAARGTVLQRHYRIERGGFAGPLRVSVADHQARHLQGVTGPTITVPAGVSEFDYPVFLPPWMETGRTSRTCVMAVGVVKDADGGEHTVSFTSVEPNDQVIVVIEPGRLDVELDRSSLTAAPGKTVPAVVRVARGKSLKGPARIELIVPAHLHGIAAESLLIPADKASGTLAVRFAADFKGPFNAPLLVRATVLDNGKPVVAETKLELLPGIAR
jgi:hypothetical protein